MFGKSKHLLKAHVGMNDGLSMRLCATGLTVVTGLCVLFFTGCGEGGGIKPLLDQLDAPQASERQKAVDEIKRVGSEAVPEVTEVFRNAANSEIGVRQVESTVKILTDTGKLESMQILAERLDDPNKRIRHEVVKGIAKLGQTRKKTGVRLLKKVMDDPYAPIVQTAARGLEKMNFPNATRVLEDVFDKKTGLASVYAASNLYKVDQRDAAAKYLLVKAGSNDERIREAAVEAATTLGTERSVGKQFVEFTVRYAMNNPDESQVTSVLSNIRDAYFEELKRTLPPQRIRSIIGILGTIADKRSVSRLVELFRNTDRTVAARIAAADALGQAGISNRPASGSVTRKKIVNVLSGMLEDDVDSRVGIAASISLALLRQEVGVTYLLEKLQNLEETEDKAASEDNGEARTYATESEDITELRCRAQKALTASGDFVVPYLLSELKQGNTGRILAWAAMHTLGDLRVRKAVPYMSEMLTETQTADQVISQPDDPPAVTKVQTKAGVVEVSTTRAAVLGDIFGDQKVVPARALSVRMAAARALGRVGGENAVRALEEGERTHQKARKAVGEYIRERGYSSLLPADITVGGDKQKALNQLENVTKRIHGDMGKVLFYIRQGKRQLAAAE